eukprot:gene14192-19044_t
MQFLKLNYSNNSCADSFEPYVDENCCCDVCKKITPKSTLQSSPKSINSLANPRSKSEQLFGNQKIKIRQLPCRTFISTGNCPYGSRCAYLHVMWCSNHYIQSSVISKAVKTKNKELIVADSFFWPPFTSSTADNEIMHDYTVVPPNPNDDLHFYLHDRGLFSMWKHFQYQCLGKFELSSGHLNNNRKNLIFAIESVEMRINVITNGQRLSCFIGLSQGKCFLSS